MVNTEITIICFINNGKISGLLMDYGLLCKTGIDQTHSKPILTKIRGMNIDLPAMLVHWGVAFGFDP